MKTSFLKEISLAFVFVFIFAPEFRPFSAADWEDSYVSSEIHWAVTSEKFELAMERLRLSKNKGTKRPAVILSHGFIVNSRMMNLDEDLSLARYLAEEGFDVWNLSLRGTGRSLNPIGWGNRRWTLDDMIEKDVPAVLEYIQKETGNRKLSWVGFDLGGFLLYGYLQRQSGSLLAGGVTVGSPVTFGHADQRPLKKLIKLEENPTLKKVLLYLDAPLLGKVLIPILPDLEKLFYNPENVDEETKQRVLESALAKVHPGVLDHLSLMIQKGEFVSADGEYNYFKNLRKVRIPLLIIGGEEDPLAPPQALRTVYRRIRSKDRTLKIYGSGSSDSAKYGHWDLIIGKNAKGEVFPRIGKWLKQRHGR